MPAMEGRPAVRSARGPRLTLLVLLVLFALLAVGLGRWWLGRLASAPEAVGPEAPDRLVLRRVSFADLPGWRQDDVAAALPAFLRSCARLTAPAPSSSRRSGPGYLPPLDLDATDWRRPCVEAARVPPGDRRAARAFFERHLVPFAASDHGEPSGLFTGYYEALLHGSRRRSARFKVPLYGRPPELVMVDLGRFRDELAGQRIAGKVEAGSLLPYPDRAAIEAGALSGRGLELVWVDDPTDAFFLQIQGSGRVELAEGGTLRLGYAAQNGHPYVAIGRELIARGALTKEEVSMQSIRHWLASHPAAAPALLDSNPSYVFFTASKPQPGGGTDGPLGAEGVPLTPGRSLAIDTRHLPLGLPVWLDTTAPAAEEGKPDRTLRRLLVAQDTGGAIRGPVRGDVFWGYGPEPEAVAGRMKSPGRLWVLLPRPRRPTTPVPPAFAGQRSRRAR